MNSEINFQGFKMERKTVKCQGKIREKSGISKWWIRGNPASEIGSWNGKKRDASPESIPIHLNTVKRQ